MATIPNRGYGRGKYGRWRYGRALPKRTLITSKATVQPVKAGPKRAAQPIKAGRITP